MSGERSPVGAVVLLDANVLYPITVCDFLLTTSSLLLLARPIVTREIMEEASSIRPPASRHQSPSRNPRHSPGASAASK